MASAIAAQPFELLTHRKTASSRRQQMYKTETACQPFCSKRYVITAAMSSKYVLVLAFTCLVTSTSLPLLKRYTPNIICRYTGIAWDDDTCDSLADRYRIGQNQLIAWNLDALSVQNCTLEVGHEYCVLSGMHPWNPGGVRLLRYCRWDSRVHGWALWSCVGDACTV